jgi:hypothetical protein
MAGALALLALAAAAQAAAAHVDNHKSSTESRAAVPVVTLTSSYEVDDGADDRTWAVRTHAAAQGHLTVLRAAYDELGACSVTLIRAAQGQALLGAVVGECRCYGTGCNEKSRAVTSRALARRSERVRRRCGRQRHWQQPVDSITDPRPLPPPATLPAAPACNEHEAEELALVADLLSFGRAGGGGDVKPSKPTGTPGRLSTAAAASCATQSSRPAPFLEAGTALDVSTGLFDAVSTIACARTPASEPQAPGPAGTSATDDVCICSVQREMSSLQVRQWAHASLRARFGATGGQVLYLQQSATVRVPAQLATGPAVVVAANATTIVSPRAQPHSQRQAVSGDAATLRLRLVSGPTPADDHDAAVVAELTALVMSPAALFAGHADADTEAADEGGATMHLAPAVTAVIAHAGASVAAELRLASWRWGLQLDSSPLARSTLYAPWQLLAAAYNADDADDATVTASAAMRRVDADARTSRPLTVLQSRLRACLQPAAFNAALQAVSGADSQCMQQLAANLTRHSPSMLMAAR